MRLAAACLSLLLPTAAIAEPIDTRNIITALSGDWNGDGAVDLAMIVQTAPTEPMDMHFFLKDAERRFLRPVEIVSDQIYGEWNGHDRPGYGNSDTEPELTALANGSIKLHMPALPIGSERMNQTLTIAYRDDSFIVAGFAYDWSDALKDNSERSCEYNVLTGVGQSSSKTENGTTVEAKVAVPGQVIPFKNWNPGTGLSACGR